MATGLGLPCAVQFGPYRSVGRVKIQEILLECLTIYSDEFFMQLKKELGLIQHVNSSQCDIPTLQLKQRTADSYKY